MAQNWLKLKFQLHYFTIFISFWVRGTQVSGLDYLVRCLPSRSNHLHNILYLPAVREISTYMTICKNTLWLCLIITYYLDCHWIYVYIYPVKPVVPLCDVHPEFGKVTTLNRENTKKTELKLLEQNPPQKYLLKNCFYNIIVH